MLYPILHAGTQIKVWVGQASCKAEKEKTTPWTEYAFFFRIDLGQLHVWLPFPQGWPRHATLNDIGFDTSNATSITSKKKSRKIQGPRAMSMKKGTELKQEHHGRLQKAPNLGTRTTKRRQVQKWLFDKRQRIQIEKKTISKILFF